MSDEPTFIDQGFAGSAGEAKSHDHVDEILGEVLAGKYEVVSRLGAGGMGYVFEARYIQLEQDVVLKTLRPELMSSGSVTERFIREAQAASRIRHPHVISVQDFGVHPRFGAFYVMEKLDGRDLENLVRSEGALAVERAIHILRQVASGLAAAHAVNIIHRDLKPANVFLIHQGYDADFVKVLDFGLARVMDANRKLTETGQVIGTPRYMAPEQCAGKKVDARADVFSAALMFWEMLTGVQPFSGLGTYEILGKKMFEDMISPRQLDPPVMLPAAVERLLMACLSKDPAWRPADGAALEQALVELAGQDLSVPEIMTPAPPPPAAAAPAPSAPAHSASAHPAHAHAQPAPAPSASAHSASAHSASAHSAPVHAAPARSRSRVWLLVAAIVVAVLGAGSGVALRLWLTSDPAPEAPSQNQPAPEQVTAEPDPTRPATMIVTVRSDPPGATVLVGADPLGTTPLDVRVPDDIADGQTVRIRLEGYQERDITIVHGVPDAHVQLHPEP